MSIETQRTQGKWESVATQYGNRNKVIDENEKSILVIEGYRTQEEDEANAKYICLAVNNHKALLDAVRKAALKAYGAAFSEAMHENYSIEQCNEIAEKNEDLLYFETIIKASEETEQP